MRVLFQCFLSLLVATLGSSGNVGNVLSQLYQKAVQSNKPLVVVLDSAPNAQNQLNPATPAPINLLNSFNQYRGSSQLQVPSQLNKYRGFSLAQGNSVNRPPVRPRQKDRDASENSALQILYLLKELQVRENLERIRKQRYQQHSVLLRNQQAPPPIKVIPLEEPSPIVKSLLRLRANLRCGQRKQCEQTCETKPQPKKDVCENKCEEKFDCPEPDEEDDPCGDGDDDDCNDDDCDDGDCQKTYSTKGLEVGPQANDRKKK